MVNKLRDANYEAFYNINSLAIAKAPWNRISLKNPPDYKGVGLTLLSFARQRSKELGYEGRVGLHALPKAEKFYKKRGMINFGIDT